MWQRGLIWDIIMAWRGTYCAKLNKEQKEAVTFDKGPLLIVAGAGTGKTTVLTHRIAYLIKEKGIRPEEITGSNVY